MEDVSFIDLAVKEMEVSASALLNNVIISGDKTKFLTIKRLYKDTALHEMEASAVTGIVDVSGFTGALEIFNFPVDRLKLNVESHFVVDFKMLDSIPWEDLGIVKVGGYWYQSISRLAKRESPEAVFSIPKSGPALDEFNVLRREKFF
ncbi:hypothetical protein R50072_32450 [Simiduia litorea]|uniref:hypothetical protein n=1 Tax=Simiduia litorea TaxID=1435348 RepID=UPI0036F3B5FB